MLCGNATTASSKLLLLLLLNTYVNYINKKIIK